MLDRQAAEDYASWFRSLADPTRIQILHLLAALRAETGVAYLCISHNLAVVRQVADQVIVMRDGQVVEAGLTPQVLDTPRHPYTRLLRSSVPGDSRNGVEADRRRQ